MSERTRPLPADMLLVEERRRRLAGAAAPDTTGSDVDVIVAVEDDRLLGDDELLRDPAFLPSARLRAFEPGDVVLRRPVASVSLVQVAWGGPVDHEALVRAIACYPVEPARAGILAHSVEPVAFVATQPGAALEVTLRRADLALLERLLAAPAAKRALPLVRAACLPQRLTGAEAQTLSAIAGVLGAYRRAALRHAWHKSRLGRDGAQFNRERDEAAVALLSTLRALLGER